MIRLFFKLPLIFLLLILIPGIGNTKENVPFQVITTFTVIQDIAHEISIGAAEVNSIIKPGAEVHNYQPTPKDIIKTQKANLILWNGMNLERWFKKFFNQLKDIPSVIVTEGIKPIPISNYGSSNYVNPHAWMSPNNAMIYVENIRKALVKYDPIHSKIYNFNATNYINKIKKMDYPFRIRIEKIPEKKRWLVTSEGAFSYLAKDYKLKEIYLWPINSDEQGTPKQIKKVIDTVRKYQIPVIFSESTVSDKPARRVSQESNAKYGGVLYVDSLSISDGPVPTYLDMLYTTIDTIIIGFEK